MKKVVGVFILAFILVACQNTTSTTRQEIKEEHQEVEVELEPEAELELEDRVEHSNILFDLNELSDEYLQSLSFLGRLLEYDVYLTTPYTLDHQAILYQTNPSSLEVIKEVMLGTEISKVKIINNQLYAMTQDELFIFDEELAFVQSEMLPDVMKGEGKAFGCDFNQDLSSISYSNTEGLWLLTQESEPILLAEPIYYEDQKLLEVSYYGMPTFINEDQHLMVEIGGYEAAAGYLICELASQSCEKLEVPAQANLTDLAYNQNYLQMFVYEEDEFVMRWFDLKTQRFLEGDLIVFDPVEGESREIMDYIQQDNEMVLAIGIKNEGQFLPKWIDIERYEILEDGTLEFLEQLTMIEDIYVNLIGLTKEGNVIYGLENYDLGYSKLQIYVSE